jgi:hypothetical protein
MSLNIDCFFTSFEYSLNHKLTFVLTGVEAIMKKTDVVEVYSQNGEVHLVLREHKTDERLRKRSGFSSVEAKAFMKKEAAKPLLLLRAE